MGFTCFFSRVLHSGICTGTSSPWVVLSSAWTAGFLLGKEWLVHEHGGKTIGKWWLNGDLMGCYGIPSGNDSHIANWKDPTDPTCGWEKPRHFDAIFHSVQWQFFPEGTYEYDTVFENHPTVFPRGYMEWYAYTIFPNGCYRSTLLNAALKPVSFWHVKTKVKVDMDGIFAGTRL